MSENYNTNLFLSLYGRDKREGCIAITGTIGADKTTMCRMVLRKAGRESQTEFALNRFCYENELLGAILQNFGILGKSTKEPIKKKIYQLIQFLLKSLKEGELALLVVDDDQYLPLSESDQEKISSDLYANKEKFLQIMLIGQVGEGHDLKSSKFQQYYNSEKCMYQDPRDPLKLDEIQKYIEHRLMVAGPTGGMHFSQKALAYIQKHPLGIPCIRNLIFDCELTDTYTQQTIETKEEIVENAVHDVTLQEEEMETFERSYAWPTWMDKMREVFLIPTVAAIRSCRKLTWMNKMRQTLLISVVAAIRSCGKLTWIDKMREVFLIPAVAVIRSRAKLTWIDKMRQALLIPAVTEIRSYAQSIWVNKRRMKVLIPGVALIFVSVVTIGFFISHRFFTKGTPTHKAGQGIPTLQGKVADTKEAVENKGQPKQNLLYSHNMMAEKNRGHVPEQELPQLQGKIAQAPTLVGEKEQFKRAIMYQKSGEFLKAEEEYLELLKLYPNDYEIHNNLGSVYQEWGNFDSAITEYRKAINLDPNYSMARYNLGVALYKKGDLQAAMKEFKIILEANPKDVRCITYLGVLSKKLNHPDRARRFFEEALTIDPTHPEAHYNLAVIFEEHDVNRAAFHFQKFLDYGTGSKYRFLEREVMERLENLYNSPSS
ncbi:MAG: tetratricopeptide repeat protein [Candidatus Scalindua sp. AMX11]|nr:MAG: tetratricopeptide repeat protein [Candidatus Scalindua sp.]NOG84745.1 tetratricopeptide repeat protein [Planctomycetota bacterium]RZV98350.1 MAG: tetratricopeptide repeat protein [Candidatus Scalindua sp. SCAELEC01]TDE66557.1 MAG: tetratricopeptide repeat protein [Candidatus Scalindua sp. AMX11]GJQ58926.1 MAG: hypothetical protein SCALA701_17270 [Candidatus Scalindua sp.]